MSYVYSFSTNEMLYCDSIYWFSFFLTFFVSVCFIELCIFFFFFKQKTAYEMRISDWSSDVCSSDLRPLLAPATLDAAFNWFEEGKRTPLIIKSNRLSRVHRPVLLDLIIVPVRDGKQVTALSIHAGMWTSAGLARSEEHTSELQSLMRISYAVFCLKKTKQSRI